MPSVLWTRVLGGDVAVGAALFLLQKTYNDDQYDQITVAQLQQKLTSTSRPLFLWSAGSTDDPDVSAFFFMRVDHWKKEAQQPPAFCMTIGARPSSQGASAQRILIDAIADVCTQLRVLNGLPKGQGIEVMHNPTGPNFRANSVDAAGAYATMTSTVSPNAPRFEKMPDIIVDYPWADVPTSLTRFNVIQ